MGNYLSSDDNNERLIDKSEKKSERSFKSNKTNKENLRRIMMGRKSIKQRHMPNFHTPKDMKADDIFEMYTKIIEDDFAFNQ